jgi:hypothetical protein
MFGMKMSWELTVRTVLKWKALEIMGSPFFKMSGELFFQASGEFILKENGSLPLRWSCNQYLMSPL